jgi:tetratricopeptide (TPR) repeat protein
MTQAGALKAVGQPGSDAAHAVAGVSRGRRVLRIVRTLALLGALGGLVAWWQRMQPDEADVAPVAPPEPIAPFVEPLVVDVVPPAVPEHPWGLEAAGHVTLLVQELLAEVPGVLPRVEGAPPAPGLAQALTPEGRAWRLLLALVVVDDTVSIGGTLCDPAGPCTTLRASGARIAPGEAVAQLVTAAAATLGRRPADPTAWGRPETRDPYAALLLGRAAAVAVGLRPPVDEADRGDVRRDPVARAVFLDPRMASAQAIVARTATDAVRRLQAARMAAEAQPRSLGRAADLAAALGAAGLSEPAREAWADVARRSPGDGRFVLPRARAALAVGDARGARAVLSELGGRHQGEGPVVAVEVAVADALGGSDDALLARWQQSAPTDPEPVHRRIALRVTEGRLEDALALTGELARRGRADEANALTVALASDLGRWDQARDAAASLGAGDVARRLAAADASPAEVVEALAEARAPEARLARAQALLQIGRAPEALQIARAVLADDPWWPEALWIESRALRATGDAAAAEAAQAKLVRADPLFFEEGRRR